MKNFLDKLQQAWQSQCSKPLDVNPDQLLNTVRLERRVNFWTDIGIVVVFSCCGAGMLRWAFRDIQKDWPWLIYSASLASVVGYVLFDRWRRRRDVVHYDEPLLAHVEGAIKEVENQKWLSGNALWWYIGQSAQVDRVFVAPGIVCTALDAENVDLAATDFPRLI